MNMRVCQQEHNCPRKSLVTRGLIWLAFACLITACSGNQPIKPWADLQIPGVKKIPGIEALQAHSDVIRVYHAVTYQSKLDSNATHVLLQNGQAVYDARLDGSQLHAVMLPCSESVAVAPGGQRVACVSDTGIQIHDLTNRNADVTLTGAGSYAGYPTWAPDGHHLASVTGLEGGCSIAIFDISPTLDTHLVELLSLPQFLTQEPGGSGCSVTRLTWSPDGTQFAFIDNNTLTLYDLPVAPLHLLTQSINSSPLLHTVSRGQVVALGRCSPHSGLSWAASSRTLTFVDLRGQRIEQVDILTYATSTLLTQHAASLFDVSWTPDGKHLLFVLGIASDELTPPPSQIYVYTPS